MASRSFEAFDTSTSPVTCSLRPFSAWVVKISM